MRAAVGAGVKVEATHKHHTQLPGFTGRHLWTVMGVWQVADPARVRHELDLENLLTLEGPRCLHCEQPWRATIGAHCPGPLSTEATP